MKKSLLKLALGFVAMTFGFSSFGQTTFNYTGSAQTYVVPGGVTSIQIECWGAEGGGNNTPGKGGYAIGNLAVTPGSTLYVYVGEHGKDQNNQGSGGGASDVRTVNGANWYTPASLSSRVIVGAGGGGSGNQAIGVGGDGGGTTGSNGWYNNASQGGQYGLGATQAAGGSYDVGNEGSQNCLGGMDGYFGGGGDARYVGRGTTCTNTNFYEGLNEWVYRSQHGAWNGGGTYDKRGFESGGGGGGWYGGGAPGSGDYGGGGGGGSSYIGGVTSGSTTPGVRSGHGQVIITQLCSATVAPTVTCPANITVNNDAGQCDAVVTYTTPTATDNCGSYPATLTSGPASGSTFPVGTTTVTYSATNSQGTVSCSFTVTVVDAEAPALTCPANITVNNDAGQCDAVVTYTAPVGTDNCSGVTTALTSGPASGSTFPIGTTTVTYTATDAASNSTPCSFTVTVVDAEAPTITCGGNVASCDPVVNGIAPTGTTDNCTGEYVTYALSGATTGTGANDASGSTFNVGTTTIWYHVTDSAGNQDSCSFDVVVHPLPVILLNVFNNDTVCLSGNPEPLPAASPSGGTFSGPGVSGSTFDPSTAGVGTHYVTYSYTDANSCTNSDSTMIVVESCVGIDENASLAGVRIYPNPTNGLVNINLGDHNGSVNYSISTIEGRLVTQERNVATNQMTIDLNNESKGIYLLRIEDATSSKVYKIIKE